MAVDFHAHWIPPALADALRKRRAAPRIEPAGADERLVTCFGSRPFDKSLGDLGYRRDLMRRCGIATQLLSLAGLFGIDCLPVAESLPLVAAFNDAASKAVTAEPLRFAAVAALPLADMEAACRELERGHGMGLRGAILPADGFVTSAVAERLRPIFETGERLGSHFFIHPGPLEMRPPTDLRRAQLDNAWQRHIVIATQTRLSEAAVTLGLSNFMDPFPHVTVQIANLGGAIPFLAERMDEVARCEMGGNEPLSTGLRRLYVDTASFSTRGIELAVAVFGVERVLLGTDCPIFDAARAVSAITQAQLDPQIRETLLRGNAERLIRGCRAIA